MNDKLKELLSVWAGVSTWNTSHRLDEKRFHQAIKAIVTELGTDIEEDEFRVALASYKTNSSEQLGSAAEDEDLQRWAKRATHIFEYLADEG